MEATEHTEVLVVGAGQAGLALGYHLQRRGRQVLLVDRNERIGDSWRARWDSLKLYSPASRDGLPGMPFPAGRTAYPTKDEMADYLEALRGAVRAARPARNRRRGADGGGRRLCRTHRRITDRGRHGCRRHGRLREAVRPGARRRAEPFDHAAPLERVPEPGATPGRPGSGGRRQPLGLGHRPRGGRAARGRALGSRHRTAPGFDRD